jgi:hypothetical protein
MTRALIVGAAALALSAGAASAQVYVSPGYGYGYGYAAPLYDYAAPATAGTTVHFDDRFHFKPQTPDVTGSVAGGPCNWNTESFLVPSSGGGTRPVQVVSCR